MEIADKEKVDATIEAGMDLLGFAVSRCSSSGEYVRTGLVTWQPRPRVDAFDPLARDHVSVHQLRRAPRDAAARDALRANHPETLGAFCIREPQRFDPRA